VVGTHGLIGYIAVTYQPPTTQIEPETSLTLDTIAKRKQQKTAPKPLVDVENATPESLEEGGAVPGSPADLEEEAGTQGAFNEETGEINWECPCLNGMAHGPCGEDFKAAFSCFVYSKEEPKGVECIEKFK
jgi:intermembrane space import and assembly protein 40